MAERRTSVPQLTRRGFLRVGFAGLSWFSLSPFTRPIGVSASEKVRVRGTAEYCIFLFQNGGPSQIDTFDFKEGRWTPPDFDLRTVKGGPLKLPYGLFPRLAGKLDDLAIVRSVEAWEVEHSRAQYYMQVAHAISPARRAEMPSLAAVVAYEMESRRKPGDFLPPFVSMNFNDGRRAGVIGSGCLDPKYSPLDLNTKGELGFLVPDTDRERFSSRWNLLRKLDSSRDRDDANPIAIEREYHVYSEGAHSIMMTPEIGKILKLEPEERKRYGGNSLGDACLLARNVIAGEAGTRYVVISHPGWDSHKNIYDRNNPSNHFAVCAEFDTALAHLLSDLAERRTKSGERLLDKTLIVCMGEFGRTVGDITVNKGRDHHRFASTALFAGGGVRGGRVLGATDPTGGRVVDSGWNKKRSIYMEDIAATIYSALGIDWSKKITNTPSGRTFEYVEPVSGTTFLDPGEIAELFA